MTGLMVFPSKLEGAIPTSSENRVASDERSHRIFFGLLLALFIASAAVTAVWCRAMSATPEMRMPGGWKMSMAWMRMSGQSWPGAAAGFICMWTVMMVAMMLPSLAPVLWCYRQSLINTAETHSNWPVVLVASGYFFVWATIGAAIFPLGTAIAAVEMRFPVLARSVPLETGVVVLMAGMLPFTEWRAHHLAFCREAPGSSAKLAANAGAAWRRGLHLGTHCGRTCANLTAILLVAGIMDLRVMALVTVAITMERLTPTGQRVAHTIGAVSVAWGVFLVAQALSFV